MRQQSCRHLPAKNRHRRERDPVWRTQPHAPAHEVSIRNPYTLLKRSPLIQTVRQLLDAGAQNWVPHLRDVLFLSLRWKRRALSEPMSCWTDPSADCLLLLMKPAWVTLSFGRRPGSELSNLRFSPTLNMQAHKSFDSPRRQTREGRGPCSSKLSLHGPLDLSASPPKRNSSSRFDQKHAAGHFALQE